MKSILDELYDSYARFTPRPEVQREIEHSHKLLIERLEKPERKLILRIIDAKDQIAGSRARESFGCGFWLAWRLFTQLHSYDSGRSLEEILGANDRFSMSEEHENDER